MDGLIAQNIQLNPWLVAQPNELPSGNMTLTSNLFISMSNGSTSE